MFRDRSSLTSYYKGVKDSKISIQPTPKYKIKISILIEWIEIERKSKIFCVFHNLSNFHRSVTVGRDPDGSAWTRRSRPMSATTTGTGLMILRSTRWSFDLSDYYKKIWAEVGPKMLKIHCDKFSKHLGRYFLCSQCLVVQYLRKVVGFNQSINAVEMLTEL